MAIAIEEDERAEIVKKLQEMIKEVGVRTSPMEAAKSERLKTMISFVLSRFETSTDRIRREQPGGSL